MRRWRRWTVYVRFGMRVRECDTPRWLRQSAQLSPDEQSHFTNRIYSQSKLKMKPRKRRNKSWKEGKSCVRCCANSSLSRCLNILIIQAANGVRESKQTLLSNFGANNVLEPSSLLFSLKWSNVRNEFWQNHFVWHGLWTGVGNGFSLSSTTL